MSAGNYISILLDCATHITTTSLSHPLLELLRAFTNHVSEKPSSGCACRARRQRTWTLGMISALLYSAGCTRARY
jgi:hypothetical protein